MAFEQNPVKCEKMDETSVLRKLNDKITIFNQDFLDAGRNYSNVLDLESINPDIVLLWPDMKTPSKTAKKREFSMHKHFKQNLGHSIKCALKVAKGLVIVLPKFVNLTELIHFFDEYFEEKKLSLYVWF